MPELSGTPQAFVGNTSAVDTSAAERVGKRAWDEDGNEYIYLKGVGSTAAGSWVVFDEDYATTLLVAGEVGPVAIAMAAVDATTKYGWYQIFGVNTVAKTDTVAADSSLYIDGTAGRADDLGVSGDLILNAYSMTADTSNVATVWIGYPSVSNDVGGGIGGPGSSTDNAIARFDGTGGSTIQNSGILISDTDIVSPATSDAGALGSSSLMWSDLFLASGGVINFNAGNATITHSAGLLTSNVALSLGVSNALTAGTIELGHATDTTIARSGAGDISIEGNAVYRAGGTDVPVADGGTGLSAFGGTNTLLYTTTANNLSSIVTGNSGLLVTGGTGIPSIATDIPTAVTIGGAYVYRVSGTDVALADGGTGASLSDPNADAMMTWDDSAGAVVFMQVGNGLNINATPTLACDSASDTVDGVVELATAAETTTGTDATRAVTPDGLAGSDYGKRVVGVLAIDPSTAITTGSTKAYVRIPSVMNGWNLVGVAAQMNGSGTTGVITIQVRNVTDNVNMLSTAITIDSGEKDSSTAATAAVINGAADDVATADQIAIDINGNHTTAGSGLYIEMIYQLP